MNHRQRVLVWFLLCSLFFSWARLETSAQNGPPRKKSPPPRSAPTKFVGSAVPDRAFRVINQGWTLELAKLRGKVVVINFWATWCIPATHSEMPVLAKVYQESRDAGLEIIGLAVDQTQPEVLKYLSKNPVSYPVGLISLKAAADFELPDGIPYTVFIDRKGIVRAKHLGAMTDEEFRSKVKSLLEEFE